MLLLPGLGKALSYYRAYNVVLDRVCARANGCARKSAGERCCEAKPEQEHGQNRLGSEEKVGRPTEHDPALGSAGLDAGLKSVNLYR